MDPLVYDSGWGIEPSWPSTVAEGDLAVVARRWTSVSGVGYPNPSPGPQWIGLGNYGTRTGATHWRAELFWWQVRGTSRPSIGPGSNFTSFRLMIFRGTAGIGRARTGRALVPVSENGGAIAIGVEASAAGDLTILPGSGSVSVGWGAASSDGVFGNPGWNHSHTRIYELLPPAGPLAPLVLAPGDGAEVAATEPVEFEWQHRPSVAGGRQDAYQLRVWDDVSDPEYWNASTGTWTTSELTNLSSTQGVVVPAAAFTVNVPMSWQVRSREGVDGRWSAWSSAASFMPVTPPSVSVTAPGDLHDDLSPLVAWDAVTPRGEQTAFRVQIAQLGTILYDSGSQPGGDDEWQVPPQDWSNGALYQARVQVQQTGGSWSSWDTRDFTISWTEPEEPVVQARRHEHGIEVTVLDGEVAQARATLEAVLGEEPVYSLDAPADTSRAWYHGGEVRRWVDYGPGPVTNLVTNPRGRATDGTVTVRENLIPNPSFETGTSGVVSGSATTVSQTAFDSAIASGISALSATVTGANASNGYVAQYVDLPEDSEGMWLGVSLVARRSGPGVSGAQFYVDFRDGSNSAFLNHTSDHWLLSTTPATEIPRRDFAVQIPAGAVTAMVWLRMRGDSAGAVPGDGTVHTDAWMAVVGRSEAEALAAVQNYFDGDTWDGDPDFTPEWTGTPGESTSRLVAPRPVGWAQSTVGVGYYSETFDSLAMVTTGEATYSHVGISVGSHASATSVVEFLDVRPFAVFEARARWDYAQTDWARNLTAPVTIRSTEVNTSSNMLVQRNATEAGDTVYFRAAAVPGEYDGPYFDGHTFGVYWDGAPDNSTSTYPGPQWAPVEDAGVVDAAQALHVAETTARTYTVERINLDGTWSRVLPWRAAERGSLRFVDVFAPYDQPTAYRAQAAVILDGVPLNSEWALSPPVTSSTQWTYLAAASSPVDTWVRVYVNEDSPHTHQRPVAVAYGLGDTDPRVSYGQLRGRTGTLRLAALDHEGALHLLGLLHAGEPLVLRWTPETGDDPDPQDAGVLVFDVAGELDVARLAQAALQRRYVSVPWVEQTAVVSVGGSLAPVTHPIEEG